MINCCLWLNKSDSSYVVSWLHSVLFPLLTIQVLKLSFKLLLLSSSSLLLLLFLALCTGWSHCVVVLLRERVITHEKRPLRFRLLTLELTNTSLKIISVPRSVVFWGQWNTNSCVQLSSHFSKFFVTLANDPTTICIDLYHLHSSRVPHPCNVPLNSWYFLTFSTIPLSPSTAISTMAHSLSSVCLQPHDHVHCSKDDMITLTVHYPTVV